MMKTTFLMTALLLSTCSLVAQDFDTFYAIRKSDLKNTLYSAPRLCGFTSGKWVNPSVSKMETDHKGKLTIVHFGTFDNYISLADMADLSELQKEFPYIRVILSLNPKFDYPSTENEILWELEKRESPLPVYIDDGFELWNCSGVTYWPTTLFFAPNGGLIESREGRLNASEIRASLPEVLNRLGPFMEKDPEPFYGMPPGRWNKRSVLEYPAGLAVNERENMIFVSDMLGHRILGLINDGNVMYCIGSGDKGFKNGALDQATFNEPRGMHMDSENYTLYVADSRNHAIRKVDLRNEVVTTILGNGRPSTVNQVKVIGTSGSINTPVDVLLVGNDLYITMQGSNEIWKMDIRTEVAEKVAGNGTFGFTVDDKATESTLAAPSGLASDLSGAIVFGECQASSIRYLDNEKIEPAAGRGVFDFGYANGKKEEILLQYPNGICSTGEEVYVADTYNHCIRKIDPIKRKAETLAGSADISGYRNGYEPFFNKPMDVELLGDELIVADAGNGLIRSINLKSGETRSIGLINYECLGRGEGLGIVDLRDGEELVLGNGLNEISYSLDVGPFYELDPTAYQNANLSTRFSGIEVKDINFGDGTVEFAVMDDPDVKRPALTMEFTVFLRSLDDPARQFRKRISYRHRIQFDQDTGFNHEVKTVYNPDKGRE